MKAPAAPIVGLDVDISGVDVQISGATVVADATLSAPSGTTVGLIGPNGSGKSSLLKAVYRVLRPTGGLIEIGGDDVWAMPAQHAALRSAVVLQDDSPDFEFTVAETVGLGRIPHRSRFGRQDHADRVAITEALHATGTTELADRSVATLSGGERQRVYLARALAQNTPVLILDEPTNHLDVLAQIELLELVTSLSVTSLIALHDLNLAATFCDTVYVLVDGRIVAEGRPSEVLNAELIATVYGVEAEVSTNPLTGKPALAFGTTLRPRGVGPGNDEHHERGHR